MTADFIVTTPRTRPCISTTGPPLLPGSTGIASCSILRPSISRVPLMTPLTTLCFRPCGLPTTTTASPSAGSLIAQIQRGEVRRVNLKNRQVERAVGSVNRFHRERFAVGRLHCDRPRLANHMQIRRDQTAFIDDKAGAQALLRAFATRERDDDDRRPNLGGDLLDAECRRLFGRNSGDTYQARNQ